jgi:hypothetical protein
MVWISKCRRKRLYGDNRRKLLGERIVWVNSRTGWGKYQAVDLFNNPVGYRTSLAKYSAFCCFLSGSCSETEVSEQL